MQSSMYPASFKGRRCRTSMGPRGRGQRETGLPDLSLDGRPRVPLQAVPDGLWLKAGVRMRLSSVPSSCPQCHHPGGRERGHRGIERERRERFCFLCNVTKREKSRFENLASALLHGAEGRPWAFESYLFRLRLTPSSSVYQLRGPGQVTSPRLILYDRIPC